MVRPESCTGDDWVGLTTDPLPVGDLLDWAVQPYCGAVVAFSGTVRDHAEGRPGVIELDYEAWAEQVVPGMEAMAAAARGRWPDLGRLVILHRTGEVAVGQASVVVVASTPHRAEAFEAARWCIDTVKTALPIWKRERWEDGSEWSLAAQPIDWLGGAGVEGDGVGADEPGRRVVS